MAGSSAHRGLRRLRQGWFHFLDINRSQSGNPSTSPWPNQAGILRPWLLCLLVFHEGWSLIFFFFDFCIGSRTAIKHSAIQRGWSTRYDRGVHLETVRIWFMCELGVVYRWPPASNAIYTPSAHYLRTEQQFCNIFKVLYIYSIIADIIGSIIEST